MKSKLVMTVFACLMARDYLPDVKQQPAETPVQPTFN